MKKSLTKESGQSLIEMIVAITLVVLVLVALVGVTVAAMSNAISAKNQSKAARHAQEAMEEIRSFRDENNWSDFVGGCDGRLAVDYFDNFDLLIECTDPEGGPDCPDDDAKTDLCQVKVIVSWKEKGKDRQTIVTSLFSERI